MYECGESKEKAEAENETGKRRKRGEKKIRVIYRKSKQYKIEIIMIEKRDRK